MATHLLQHYGMEVVTAVNGEEALQKLQQESVDGVLMDCQMPVMDGYSATRKIRQQPEFALLPIIALSGNVVQGEQVKAIEAGMDDFVAKPIDVDELLEVLIQRVGR